MKIVMIGPVYPFKGGISHYTGLMYRELSKKHDVMMISFKMQYPKLLYKKEQRDYSNDSFQIEDTRYLLNTVNPLNWIQTAKAIKREKPDLIIMQWWHIYFAPCYYMLNRILKKTKKLYICHNVFPHERVPLDRRITRMVLKHGDRFVVHSHLDQADLLSLKPDARHVVTPHPTYDIFKMHSLSGKAAREWLCIDESKHVILFFGFVREYKGLKHLLRAMPMISELIPDVQLWVVGDFGSDKQDYIDMIDELGIAGQIKLVAGYVPDQEVEKYFAAADLVVLPYESATQSGIVQISYGFEKPVVVTDVGGLPDVVEDGKTGYVVRAKDSKALADAVVKYFTEDRKEELTNNIKAAAHRFSWEVMAQEIEAL